MSLLNRIGRWLRSELRGALLGQGEYEEFDGEEIDRREFEWCIVGNIVDKHHWGTEKIIKHGTKHFAPGTKVYCLPEFGGMAHEKMRVIGKPRKRFRRINIVIPTKMITNFRVQKVYHPKIQFDVGSHVYYWSNRRQSKEVENLEKTAKYLATLTEEITEDNEGTQ